MQLRPKFKFNSHESANQRLALAVAGGHDPHPVGRPLEIIYPARENPKLLLEHVVVVVGPPDPDGPGHVGGGDPLAVGRVAGDGGLVSVLAVDVDVEGAVEVADDDGAAVAVEDGVGLGVAGDQDPAAALRRRHAGVGLGELSHCLPRLVSLSSFSVFWFRHLEMEAFGNVGSTCPK